MAIRENTNAGDGSAATKLFCRIMLAQDPTRWNPQAKGLGQAWNEPERTGRCKKVSHGMVKSGLELDAGFRYGRDCAIGTLNTGH